MEEFASIQSPHSPSQFSYRTNPHRQAELDTIDLGLVDVKNTLLYLAHLLGPLETMEMLKRNIFVF